LSLLLGLHPFFFYRPLGVTPRQQLVIRVIAVLLDKTRETKLKLVLTMLGIVIAAIGGVIAYRALFLEPSVGVVITESKIEELPNYTRIAGGLVLLIGGAALAIVMATRRSR
jgi:hypothetical protein